MHLFVFIFFSIWTMEPVQVTVLRKTQVTKLIPNLNAITAISKGMWAA